MTHEPRALSEEESLSLLMDVLSDDEEGGLPPAPPCQDALGVALQKTRAARGLTTRQMAEAVRVPHETYQAWQADAGLPHAEHVPLLCDLLHANPTRVLMMIAETARRILREALEDAAPVQQLMAARQRGPAVDDGDDVLVLNLPLPVRRNLARRAGVGGDDVSGIAAWLRALAVRAPEEREREIRALGASLVLEGEDPGASA